MITLEEICPIQGGVFTWQYLQILMCWPSDVEQQNQALRATYLNTLGIVEAKTPREKDFWTYFKGMEPHRKRLGGWRALAEAPPLSEIEAAMEARTKDGLIAGGMLRLLHALHAQAIPLAGGPSLNKIVDFLRQHGESIFQQNRTFTKANLMAIWNEYKPVAHLWAAHVSLVHKHCPVRPEKDSLLDPAYQAFDRQLAAYIHRLYCMAKHLQEFGLTFKAKGSAAEKKNLLDPETCLLLGEVPQWKRYRMPTFLFPEGWVDALKAYQAPKVI